MSGGGEPADDDLDPEQLAKLVNSVGILIRSGFDPQDALREVGLDPIKHLGLLPVTVQHPNENVPIDQASAPSHDPAAGRRTARW